MAGPLPVKGTEISSAPCSVRKAASLMRRFLLSEAAQEDGIARGYVETVAQSLEEILARGSYDGTEGLRLKTAGPSSKFFNVEQVPKIVEVEKKSRRGKKSKQKNKDQAMVDFEALLGHELDGAEIGNQGDVALDFEDESEIPPSTPRQVDSLDDGRVSQKSEKRKKKKSKSLGGADMDVDKNGMQSSRKAEGSDPDVTETKKKKKKRKSLDGATPNGLLILPAEEIKAESRAEDEDFKPVVDIGKKKKKKHQGNTSQGATPTKQESKKVLAEHTNSSTGDRGVNGNASEMHQQDSVKMKSKKRSGEVSPGNFDDHHRKSKKLRSSD